MNAASAGIDSRGDGGDTERLCVGTELLRCLFAVDPHDDVDTRGSVGGFCEVSSQAADNSLQLLGIQGTELFDIGLIKALFHEKCQSQLLHFGTGLGVVGADGTKNVSHSGRQYHIADFDGGEQGGGKGTKINNLPLCI